ncbi:MAG: NADH-quinone oxidoreductase subunit N [Leptonema sp. (in: Bacteria)]|nr:NADH-quinone oxidoreductase subunit N [Leptonema sp. (in: bacteria)]
MLSTVLTILFSADYLKQERAVTGEYYALLMLATAGMITLIVASEFLTLFVGLELVSLAGYVLAGYFRTRERSIEASLKYFLPGVFATGLILYGIATLFGATGSLSFQQISATLTTSQGQFYAIATAAVLILAGFSFKVAVAPFHAWAPDVYDGAAAPVSVVLSTGVKAAAFAALLRMFIEAFNFPGTWIGAFATLSVITMILGNVGAFLQKNVKRMLAYSSVAHAGYVVIAFTTVKIASADYIYHSVAVYMLAYTLMTGGAFGLLGYLGNLGQKGETRTDLADLAGLARTAPWVAVVMAVFMFSLAGFPPTAGFFGKYYVFKLAIENNYVWLAVLGVINSFLSVAFYLRVIVYMFMEPQVEKPVVSKPPVLVVSALLICVIGIFVAGFLPLAS